MTKSIFLCASMNFYKELVAIERELTDKGYLVRIPTSAMDMKKRNDFEVSHFKGVVSDIERSKLIMKNFENIKKSDAILVINNEKNGINGYIGANVLMEIGLAFYFGKKIFLLNPTSTDAPHNEELRIFGATTINKKLENINV